ncbi:hypothetical protein J008_01083 [Cryptococcus neoformans]|nr:hypothetical protein C362_00485 [Cryptococcus neoformans var. grubii Bt1]OXG32325.1 hypothetical protein C367_01093 [Cryptococcus neoformans var. grubii Ze90-1]OXH40581.1 hypothetical protein J008_01083 [Cryptococcus neoformans var. grubii]
MENEDGEKRRRLREQSYMIFTIMREKREHRVDAQENVCHKRKKQDG